MTTKKLSQKEKFIQAAKELECDESEKNFSKKLKKLSTSTKGGANPL